MREEEINRMMGMFFEEGYLVGKTDQRDILFKYSVPIDVERKISLTICKAHNAKMIIGVLNPSGVAYTYQFINGIEDHITEVPYDGTMENLFKELKKRMS